MKIVEKPYGCEKWVVNTDQYCGKIIIIKKGYKNSLHRHHKKDETFLLLKGKIKLTIGLIEKTMYHGDSERVKPEIYHRFEALEDSEIIEFSTHHDDNDVERIPDERKKTYCFDIDGTICTVETPDNYANAKPITEPINRIEEINKLYDNGHTIYLYTGRHMMQEKLTKEWLKKYGVKYHHIFFGKPVADKYIDDRGEKPELFFSRCYILQDSCKSPT